MTLGVVPQVSVLPKIFWKGSGSSLQPTLARKPQCISPLSVGTTLSTFLKEKHHGDKEKKQNQNQKKSG